MPSKDIYRCAWKFMDIQSAAGNGFPLAAVVTTEAIAKSFNTGATRTHARSHARMQECKNARMQECNGSAHSRPSMNCTAGVACLYTCSRLGHWPLSSSPQPSRKPPPAAQSTSVNVHAILATSLSPTSAVPRHRDGIFQHVWRQPRRVCCRPVRPRDHSRRRLCVRVRVHARVHARVRA